MQLIRSTLILARFQPNPIASITLIQRKGSTWENPITNGFWQFFSEYKSKLETMTKALNFPNICKYLSLLWARWIVGRVKFSRLTRILSFQMIQKVVHG